MIELRSTHLHVEVDPEYGAEIRAVRAPGGPNALFLGEWESPIPARQSVSYGSDALDFLSSYRGAWQELFPNAGAACEVAGVPLPFHGEVASARWQVLESSPESLRVSTGTRLALTLERRMRLAPDRPALLIEETATNESPLPMPFIWGHHPAFDAPPGTLLDVPATTVNCNTEFTSPLVDVAPGSAGRWPFAPGRHGPDVDLRVVPAEPVERLIYLGLSASWAALRRPDGLGIAMAWDIETFGHCWLWQEYGGPDFPWYGRAGITAIEPQVAWPEDGLAAAAADGRARVLEPGASHRTWITMALFDAAPDRPVTGVGRAGEVTTGSTA